METKPYAAFGYVILKNKFNVGEVLNDELVRNNEYFVVNSSPFSDGDYGGTGTGYVWLYTTGKLLRTNLDSGETKECGAGWCNIVDRHEIGKVKIEFLEPMVMFCLNAVMNNSKSPKIPVVSFFSIKSGDRQSFHSGTKLFLAHGKLSVDQNTIESPKQIRVTSESKLFVAQSDCYGFLFP